MAEFFTKQIGILYLDQGLDMAIPQINQIDCVLVARDYVRELLELVWEQGLQISDV